MAEAGQQFELFLSKMVNSHAENSEKNENEWTIQTAKTCLKEFLKFCCNSAHQQGIILSQVQNSLEASQLKSQLFPEALVDLLKYCKNALPEIEARILVGEKEETLGESEEPEGDPVDLERGDLISTLISLREWPQLTRLLPEAQEQVNLALIQVQIPPSKKYSFGCSSAPN